MDQDTLAVIGRGLNLVLGILILIWLSIRRVRHPQWYRGASMRNDVWFMSFFWLLALVVGTAEQLFETGTVIRVAFSFAALLVTLRLLFRQHEDWGNHIEI